MTKIQTYAVGAQHNPTLLELWEGALTKLTRLVQTTELGTFSVEAFIEVEEHLDCVPLARSEYGLVKRRLANARRYLQEGENGAAHFELRQLARSLHGTARQWAPVRESVV
jgi:hypothetical protein